MRKFKIHNDPKKGVPSEEMISRQKDFKGLRMQYDEVTKRQHIPLYKNKRMFLLLLLIAVTAYAIYISSKEEKKDQNKDVQSTQQEIKKD